MTAMLFLKYFFLSVSVSPVPSYTLIEKKAQRQGPDDFHLFSVDFLQPVVFRPIRFLYYPWLLVHSYHGVRNDEHPKENKLIKINKRSPSMKNDGRWENVSTAIWQTGLYNAPLDTVPNPGP